MNENQLSNCNATVDQLPPKARFDQHKRRAKGLPIWPIVGLLLVNTNAFAIWKSACASLAPYSDPTLGGPANGGGYSGDCVDYWVDDPSDEESAGLPHGSLVFQGPSNRPAGGATADPVSGDGELLHSETDLTLPGLNFTLEFTRTYRSKMTYNGSFGWSWMNNFEQRVVGGQFNGAQCDGSFLYYNGRMGATRFLDTGASQVPRRYQSDDGDQRLSLYYDSTLSKYSSVLTIVDNSNGYTYHFGAGGYLTSIDIPHAPSVSLTWKTIDATAPQKGYLLTSVQNNNAGPGGIGGGTVVYLNYYANSSLVECLSLKAGDCTSALASYAYDTGLDLYGQPRNDLTHVYRGVLSLFALYTYHHDEPNVDWVPSDARAATCQDLCAPAGAKAANGCAYSAYCAEYQSLCAGIVLPDSSGSVEGNCIRYLESACFDKCKSQLPANQYYSCSSLCYTYGGKNAAGYYTGSCDATQRPVVKQQCTTYFTSQYPYCFSADNASCLLNCRNHFNGPNEGQVYTFGAPADLRHNLEMIQDGDGMVLLRNTYGSDPSDVSFDRITSQTLGDPAAISGTIGTYTFEYHDFSIESRYPPGREYTPPSTPNPIVGSAESFSSISICPKARKCSPGSACPPADPNNPCADAGNDGSGAPGSGAQQVPAFASLITNPQGGQIVQYLSSQRSLLRTVDLSLGLQADYNYLNNTLFAQLDSNGSRIVYKRNASGLPVDVYHIPAPNMIGNTTPQHEQYVYGDTVGLSAWELVSYNASIETSAAGEFDVYYTGGNIQPSSVNHGRFSSGPAYTYTYVAPFILPATRTSRAGTLTNYSAFDHISGRPQVAVIDVRGTASVTQNFHYDPLWGTVTETNVNGLLTTGTPLDPQGRVHALQRKMFSAQSNWDRSIVYGYTNNSVPATASDTEGLNTTLTYDSNGNIVNQVDSPSLSAASIKHTCNRYDAEGRLIRTVLPEGNSLIYDYDVSGRFTAVRKGYTPIPAEIWAKDCAANAPTQPTGDNGIQWISWVSYGQNGFIDSLMKDGVVYTVRTDGFGRPAELNNNAGTVVRRGYDGRGRIIWEATLTDSPTLSPYHVPQFGDDGLVSMVEWTYDGALNRYTSISKWHLEDSQKAITTYSYNDGLNSVLVTEGTRTTNTTRDGVGRVISVVAPDGSRTTTVYTNTDSGLHGAEVKQTNLGNVAITRDYDSLGMLTQQTVNGVVTFLEKHNIDGLATARGESAEPTWYFGYDDYGRLNSQHIPDGPAIISTWDGNDRRTSVVAIPAQGKPQTVSSDSFDGLDRILRHVDALYRPTTYRYDVGPRIEPSLIVESSGVQRTIHYNAAGRLADVETYSPSEPKVETKAFTYTTTGKMATATLTNAASGVDSIVWLGYDSLGRKTSDENSYVGSTATHRYDLYDGWKETTVLGLQDGAPTIKYTYDSLKRLLSVDGPNETIASFDYNWGTSNGEGGPITVNYPNSKSETRSYDSLNRQSALTVFAPGGAAQSALASSRGAIANKVLVGNPPPELRILGQWQDIYGDDGAIRERQYYTSINPQWLSDFFAIDRFGAVAAENSRLVGAPTLTGVIDNSSVSPYLQQGLNWRRYQSDGFANNTAVTSPTGRVVRQYNSLGQLSGDSSGTPYVYDSMDNLTTLPNGAVATFDSDKHVISAAKTNGEIAYYAYDAIGRRIGQSADRVTWDKYTWDGEQIVAHCSFDYVDAAYLDIAGQGVDEHLAYLQTQPASVGVGTGFESLILIHQGVDHSVLALSEDADLLVSYQYSALGESFAYPSDRFGNNPWISLFGYHGALVDSVGGTVSMRAREYSPALGRFLSSDPLSILAGPNLYEFANGYPLNFGDPSGLFWNRLGNQFRPTFTRWADPQGDFGVRRHIPVPVMGALNAFVNDLGKASLMSLDGQTPGWKLMSRMAAEEGLLIFETTALISSAIDGPAGVLTAEAADVARVGAEEAYELAAQAQSMSNQIHNTLDPIAQDMRTTSVMLGVDAEGNLVGTAAGGAGTNLSRDQISEANDLGLQSVSYGGEHAELKNAVIDLSAGGLNQAVLAASRPFCGVCTDTLQSNGWTILDPSTAAKGW